MPAGLSGSLDVLRARGFGVLLASNLLQFLFFQVLSLAMIWLLTDMTSSRAVIGQVGIAQGATVFLVAPLAGVLVDRSAKRRLLIGGRLLVTGVVLAVWAVLAAGQIQIWHLVAASIAAGAILAVMGPAAQTYTHDLVGGERLPRAIALNATGSAVSQVLGQSSGGVFVALVGVAGAYAVSAGGLLTAALLLLAIPVAGAPMIRARGSALGDLREGLAHVLSRPPLWLTLLGAAMAVFNGALYVMRPAFARWVMDLGAEGFGILQATGGAGTLLAAVSIVFLPAPRRYGLWITGAMLAYAVCLVLYSYAFSFAYLLVIEFATGFVAQLWNVWAISGFQLAVPEEMRGRVLSIVMMLAQLGFVGYYPIGLLADRIGDQLALRIFGLIPCVILALMLIFGWRVLRRM